MKNLPAFILLLALTVLTARAEKPVNTTLFGVAIKGYDPVAYFTDAQPVEGSTEFTTDWNGAKWRFASSAHLAAFKAEPEKYAPQYGGYCAWAISQGHTAPIDPAAWRIVNGKLYLNYNPEVQKKWTQAMEANIAKADANWPKLLEK